MLIFYVLRNSFIHNFGQSQKCDTHPSSGLLNSKLIPGSSQQKRVVFLWKRCDVAPVAGRQLVPSLCRTPDHSKSLIEAFLKSNPGDELFWTRHCPEGRGGSGGESDHVPRIAEERARVRHTFDGSSQLLSKSAQFDGLSNESSQLGLNLKAIMFPEWEREEKGGCRKVID